MATYETSYTDLNSLLESPEMKDVNPVIRQKIEKIRDDIDARHFYAEEMTTKQSDVLAHMRKETFAHPFHQAYLDGKLTWDVTPYMISGPVSAKFLQFVISMVQAKNVLELGLFTGYTAVAMAEALPSDGTVHTCEISDYIADLARGFISQSPHSKKIHIHMGPGAETLKKLAEEKKQFDVVFIDADKPGYRDYFDIIVEKNLLSERGIILADNALYRGRSYLNPKTREENPMNDFNEHVLSKPEFEQVLLPIRDGILAIRRKSVIQGQP